MSHISSGRDRRQNDLQFKTDELSISEVFYLVFSECDWPQGSEATESETARKQELLCSLISFVRHIFKFIFP